MKCMVPGFPMINNIWSTHTLDSLEKLDWWQVEVLGLSKVSPQREGRGALKLMLLDNDSAVILYYKDRGTVLEINSFRQGNLIKRGWLEYWVCRRFYKKFPDIVLRTSYAKRFMTVLRKYPEKYAEWITNHDSQLFRHEFIKMLALNLICEEQVKNQSF